MGLSDYDTTGFHHGTLKTLEGLELFHRRFFAHFHGRLRARRTNPGFLQHDDHPSIAVEMNAFGKGMRIVCRPCRQAIQTARYLRATYTGIKTYRLYSTNANLQGELGNVYVPRQLSPDDISSLARRCMPSIQSEI
jgi:hypothetical protein